MSEIVDELIADGWKEVAQIMGGIDDDDTPAMPTLEDALARLAMESPEAARAARNFLEGTDNLRTVWVRFRVSERERTAIEGGMRAAGVEKISEYCRGKVLG